MMELVYFAQLATQLSHFSNKKALFNFQAFFFSKTLVASLFISVSETRNVD